MQLQVDAAMVRVSNLDAGSAERVLLLLLERELKIFSQQVIQQHGLNGPKVSCLTNERPLFENLVTTYHSMTRHRLCCAEFESSE